MAVFKCRECGETKEGRCKPRKCQACGAAESFETGAWLFSGVDRLEEAKTRHGAAVRLAEHGKRYGGAGSRRASSGWWMQ